MENSDHGTTYMRAGGDDGELRPWHYIYVYSITFDMELVAPDGQNPLLLKLTEVPLLH